MIYSTRVHGIPCKCKVINYSPYKQCSFSGAMEDQNLPDDEEFNFELLDTRGRRAEWLDKYLTPKEVDNLLDEYITLVQAEYYMVDSYEFQ